MKIVQFVGAHTSPLAGKPVFVNPLAVGFVTEGMGSKEGKPVTAIHCGGNPTLVSSSVEETLAKLGFIQG